MPQAIARNKEPDKFDLESLPGGFVALRKLTYGEIMHRRDLTTKITPGQGRGDAKISMDNTAVTVFEFSRAIVDHNLEDDGMKLDLSKRATIEQLDPVIAQEIEQLIADMNQLPEDDKKSAEGVRSTDSQGFTSGE